ENVHDALSHGNSFGAPSRRRSSSFMNSSRSFRPFSAWRVFSVKYRWPVILEFCSDSAQARNCLEMISTCDFKSEISDLRSANSDRASRQSIRAHFARRPARDVEKRQKLLRGAALEAFG